LVLNLKTAKTLSFDLPEGAASKISELTFLLVTLAAAGQDQPPALDLLKLALFGRIGAVFGKFPSLRGAGGKTPQWPLRLQTRNGALREFVDWENAGVPDRRINFGNPKAFVLMINKNIF
jgi:hypothetical protein